MILVLLVILVAIPQIPGDCPPQCECKWKSGKDSVICSNSNLTNIPPRLGEGTQILDLTGNPVSTIGKDAFNGAGLLNLQKIFFSKCKIRAIDKYAFRKLNNLVELDLSYNLLSSVPSHTFDSIPELRELKLNGNPIKKIVNDAFAGVPQLVKLELTDCHISFLEPRAFVGLENSLEWLKLDRNRITETRSNTITSLLNLHGLELSGNPWNCTCQLRALREWMTSHKIPSSVPPGCRNPARIAGKTWDKLSIDEFACCPTIAPVSPTVQVEESTNVTMSCIVFGSPQPSVKWMWKNRPIANASGTSIPSHKKTYVLNHSDNKTSLTIFSVEPSDTGIYFCVASNKAGKVEGNVTLSVNRQNPEPKLNGKILFSGAVVALLFLVASCLLICFLGQPKKDNRTVQADNYEKIEMDKKCSGRYSEIASTNKVHPKMCEYRGVPSGEEADADEEAGTPSSNFSEQGRIALVPLARDVPPTELYPELSGVQQHILRKELLPTGSLYTTATTTGYDDRDRERERNYPDLVTAPPATAVHYSSATLPRSKNWYPRVSSSQSPLLAGSRCGSSADDSTSSNRRFSAESRSSSYYRLARAGDRSASSLNLDQDMGSHPMKSKQWHHPSLPTSPVRHRPSEGQNLPGHSETPILNLLGSAVYDYHAAQLERFLEEYRSLQDQLNRMKETCEGFLEQPKPELPTDPYAHNRYTSSSIYNDMYRT